MEYAVVRFMDENAPGIVSSNWLNRRKGTCWFPDVKSDMKKNKLLVKRAIPGDSWIQCSIKVLKEFDCYQSAKNYLSEIEGKANSEFANELNSSRKRQKASVYLSDEDSSEEDESIRKKSKNHPDFKFHPSFSTEPPANSKLSQNQYQVIFSLPVPSPARIESMETPGHSRNSDSEVSESRTASLNQDYTNPRNKQGIITDIEQLKTNQTNICNTLAQLFNLIKRVESKVDLLLSNSREQSSSFEPQYQSVEDMYLISSAAANLDEFNTLNEKIVENSAFRQRLALILKTAGGKNTRNLVSNILRKVVSDDVAEKFSLTGKNIAKSGVTKQPFEMTAVYKLILEVCCNTFSDAKENTVREAISDWLMQSKFRKMRKQKRTDSTQPIISVIHCAKEEHSGSDDE